MHEVLILDWIRKLVFIVVFGVTFEYLIAKLFHDVEVRGVNELSGNNLEAFDARYFDSFLVENMNVVMRHDDKTVLFYVLFLLLVTHKCEEYNVFFFQDFKVFFALIGELFVAFRSHLKQCNEHIN